MLYVEFYSDYVNKKKPVYLLLLILFDFKHISSDGNPIDLQNLDNERIL